MTQILIFSDDDPSEVEAAVRDLGFELDGNVYGHKNEAHITLQLDDKPHQHNLHWAEFARATSNSRVLFMDYHLDDDGNETDELCPAGKAVYGAVLGRLRNPVKYNTLGQRLK